MRGALGLAAGTKAALHLVHLSQPESVEAAAEARRRGVDVSTETCPHYLTLTLEDLERVGAWAVCQPPLRDSAAREGLWRLLACGEIDNVGSDHCAYTQMEKASRDAWRLAPGINGVQLSLPLLVHGALTRGIPLTAVARAHSSQPARRFGLYPGKGATLLGSDADLVLVSTTESLTVTAGRLFTKCPGTPYEGMTIGAKVKRTLVRGRTVFVDDGQPRLQVDGGFGLFLRPRPRIATSHAAADPPAPSADGSS